MTDQEYRDRRAEVKSKFTEDFYERYLCTDPLFLRIVDGLANGKDPYWAIERLIEDRNELFRVIKEHHGGLH